MTRAIELRELFRVHSTPEGDAAALQGLSLSVRERELLIVLGPSGSGKSTLLRILAGLDRPSAGNARVFGADLSKLSGRALGRYRADVVGYADQHYSRALEPELSARELVALPLGLRGVPRAERRARADELLERVGLLAERSSRPTELSGGEQQRVALCAALAHRPRLFLADEPTGELDPLTADRVYDLISALAREERCTAVIVSHDPGSARIGDRVIRIRDGRVAAEFGRATGGEDTIVVGRGGWIQLPEELLLRAGIQSRARARVDETGIRVEAVGEREEAPARVERSIREPRAASAASTLVAELRDVSKAYRAGTGVLRGFDASLRSGRLYALTGPSGSGKTTMLNLIAGLDLPSGGEVTILGTPLASLDRAERARFRREHVAFVTQQVALTPFLSARENVELALALRGIDGAEARRRALEALDEVGLTERATQRVSRLSAGETARVAVARALAARPALLLADEPTSRLDEANARAVAALLARLAREGGATIVCATHDPVVVEQADEELALDRLSEAGVAAAV